MVMGPDSIDHNGKDTEKDQFDNQTELTDENIQNFLLNEEASTKESYNTEDGVNETPCGNGLQEL